MGKLKKVQKKKTKNKLKSMLYKNTVYQQRFGHYTSLEIQSTFIS